MKLLPTLSLCIAGAVAGSGLGWILRGATPHQSSAKNSQPVTDNDGAPVVSKNSRGPAAKNAANGSAVDELGAELARHTGAMRWLYILGAADKATAADMPRLLRAIGNDQIALRMLAVRWAELDPRHMFDSLCADAAKFAAGATGVDLSAEYQVRHILFEEWAKKDREAAIAALQDRRALPGVESLRYTLTNTIMKADPARGLRLMTEWSITGYIPDMSGIAKWADQDPRGAADAVMSSSLGHAGDDAMQRVGKAWAASDPAAALAFAAEKRGLLGIHLAQSVVTEWAQRDLNAAIAHVAAQDDSLARARLGIPLVEAWAKTDPQSALQWANENLKGEARAAAAGSIVKSMAAKDIDSAAQFIATLEPGGGKNRAVNQLIDTWLDYNKGTRSGGKAEASAALTWMASLPDADTRRQAMDQAAWRLFYHAADETVAFLNSPQGAGASQQLFDHAARHLATKNPESAMQWVAGLPAERRSTAQQSVLSEWVSSRPDAALAWVRQLPAGDERAQSITATTAGLSWQSTDATRNWLQSLPAADRPAALIGLRNAGPALSDENRAALEAVVK